MSKKLKFIICAVAYIVAVVIGVNMQITGVIMVIPLIVLSTLAVWSLKLDEGKNNAAVLGMFAMDAIIACCTSAINSMLHGGFKEGLFGIITAIVAFAVIVGLGVLTAVLIQKANNRTDIPRDKDECKALHVAKRSYVLLIISNVMLPFLIWSGILLILTAMIQDLILESGLGLEFLWVMLGALIIWGITILWGVFAWAKLSIVLNRLGEKLQGEQEIREAAARESAIYQVSKAVGTPVASTSVTTGVMGSVSTYLEQHGCNVLKIKTLKLIKIVLVVAETAYAVIICIV